MKYPNESSEYRKARDHLLDLELQLRQKLSEVAQVRQQLPLGGKISADYEFENIWTGKSVRISELFTNGKKSLVIYSLMFAPDANEPCPMCNSIIDSFNGNAPHVLDRINFAIVCKTPVKKAKHWAESRDWKNLILLSSFKNSYNHDYHAETPDGKMQLPALNVFTKKGSEIFHFYATEVLYADIKGQPRHVDLIWPLWNIFDLTPEGRGTDWYPKLRY